MRRLVLLILSCSAAITNATTYYVRPSGNDSWSGTTWNTAWRTLARVNDTTRFTHGDTAVFGTGIWRGNHIMAISGTGSDKTCYIDSAFLTGQHSSRVAWIYGSDSLGGWTRIGTGNTYITAHTPRNSANVTPLWQGDSLIWRQADSVSVNAPGKWWYGNGHIVAYVYNIGGAGYDPDAHDMEIAVTDGIWMSRSSIYGGAQDNISVVGLGFKYQHGRTVNNTNNASPVGWDSCLFSHCYMSNVAGWAGINPSLIYNAAVVSSSVHDPLGGPYPDGYDHNRIVACSLGTVYAFADALPQTEPHTHGCATDFYGLRFSVIDSNVIFGYQSHAGFYFKCPYSDGDNGSATFDTLRYNVIDNSAGALPPFQRHAIRIYGTTHDIVIYGNIIKNTTWGVTIGYRPNGFGVEGNYRIYNNTFYNVSSAFRQTDFEGHGYGYPHKNSQFKYNVVYTPIQRTQFGVLDSSSFWSAIDSNYWYTASGTSTWSANGSTRTFSQWQGLGLDVHGSNVSNPLFDNASAADPWAGLTRSTALNEMNRTYGGQVWTIYGAVQVSNGPDTGACCDGRVGDVDGQGTFPDEVTIGDILNLVAAVFEFRTCNGLASCLSEADINQSGGIDPDCSDVTVSDIQTLIHHLFVAGLENEPLNNCQ